MTLYCRRRSPGRPEDRARKVAWPRGDEAGLGEGARRLSGGRAACAQEDRPGDGPEGLEEERGDGENVNPVLRLE